MRMDKNKIVFISVVVIVVIFIVAYTALVITGEDKGTEELQQPQVPELKEEKKKYTSKMDALNDLKEVRRNDPPSIYSEKFLDSLGVFDPALEEKDRERVVDSIYYYGSISYEEGTWREDFYDQEIPPEEGDISDNTTMEELIRTEEFSAGHKNFFRPRSPVVPVEIKESSSDILIAAQVHGDQVVRANDRLELILGDEARINNRVFPKNTLIYGFVSLRPNRLHVQVTHVNNQAVKLKAYDLQDSNEGIYVENSFRAEATREVLDDLIQDINVAGLPQVSGIKNIFRKNNRKLKVTVTDQYQLILKPEL